MPNSEGEVGLLEVQLYDLEQDVREQNNICEEHPDVVKELKVLLAKYVNEGRSTPETPQKNNGTAIWKTVSWL